MRLGLPIRSNDECQCVQMAMPSGQLSQCRKLLPLMLAEQSCFATPQAPVQALFMWPCPLPVSPDMQELA